MSNILKILDRFQITDRGTVYVVKIYNSNNIQIGDIFEDLLHNHFRLKGIEMLRQIPNREDSENMPIGLSFELIDGTEARGSILISGQQKVNFLFCNHPLYSKKVDEDYEYEYQEASHFHPCALFSYEDLLMGRLSLYGEKISGLTIYRGWMMRPDLYNRFYKLLEAKNIILINSPEEYDSYHMLPGWYKDFKEETPLSFWEKGGNLNSALNLTKNVVGSFIVKDYVKSRKHEWYDACFIEDVSDKANTSKIISNFLTRQGADLVGGVVLRKFEKLRHIGFHEKSGMPISEEYRLFILAGHIIIVDDYWRENETIVFSDEEQKWMEEMAARVKSNFVAMDIARKEDGSLIIMEFGDGQVSGIQQIDPKTFYLGFE